MFTFICVTLDCKPCVLHDKTLFPYFKNLLSNVRNALHCSVACKLYEYRTGDRIWHGVIGSALSTVGALMTGIFIGLNTDTTALQIMSLTLAKLGQGMFYLVFIALQSQIVPKNCAASAFSIIKTVGVSGGIVGPYMIGAMKEAFDSYAIPMYVMSVCYAITAILFFQLRYYVHKSLNVQKEIASMVEDDNHSASNVELNDIRDSLAPLGEEFKIEGEAK